MSERFPFDDVPEHLCTEVGLLTIPAATERPEKKWSQEQPGHSGLPALAPGNTLKAGVGSPP